MGQPSASTHLRSLEAAIGQRLVIRNGRGSRLTAAGKIVALHAGKILSTLESMRSALDARTEPSSGELVLAASHTPSLVLIPPLLRGFSERFPGVTIKVRTLPSATVAREVARGGVDVGIAGEVLCPDPVLRHQILIEEHHADLDLIEGGTQRVHSLAGRCLINDHCSAPSGCRDQEETQ